MRDRLDAIIADVTFALRQLRRSPVLAIAAILCFALGIGLNSAIFSIVNGVLIRPLPYRDADRIVVINEGLPKMNPGMGRISAAELVDYRELDGRCSRPRRSMSRAASPSGPPMDPWSGFRGLWSPAILSASWERSLCSGTFRRPGRRTPRIPTRAWPLRK